MHYLLVVIVLLRKTKEARIPPYGNYFTKKGYRDTGIINLGNDF